MLIFYFFKFRRKGGHGSPDRQGIYSSPVVLRGHELRISDFCAPGDPGCWKSAEQGNHSEAWPETLQACLVPQRPAAADHLLRAFLHPVYKKHSPRHLPGHCRDRDAKPESSGRQRHPVHVELRCACRA